MVVRQDILSSPEVTPVTGGVLEHAAIFEDMNWQQPDSPLFESYNCMLTDRRATWPCPETFLVAPVQAALTSSGVGGFLAAGTYYFTVTAINDYGETLQSNQQQVVLAGATSQVTVHWAEVEGATGYNVYYAVDVANPKVKYAGASEGEDSLVITGEFPPDGGDPPTENTAQIVQVKTFDASSWPEVQRAVLYGGMDCKNFGQPNDQAEMVRVFEARESYGLERVLMETVLQGATDLTPAGGAVSPKVALALLEGHAAGSYAGLPTVHLPRVIGSLLASESAIEAQGGKFYSNLGSKIAMGGGYDVSNVGPDGTPAAAGTYWAYASGTVVAVRSPLVPKDGFDTETNVSRDLVERAYLVAVDCYTSAVLVSIE